MYWSKYGKNFTQVGVDGLVSEGTPVEKVTAVWKRKLRGGHYIFIGTKDGRLMKSDVSHLGTWVEVSTWSDMGLEGMITDIQGYRGKLNVAITEDDTARVYVSDKKLTEFTQRGEDGLGNNNTMKIKHLHKFRPRGPLYATTWNETDGAELYRWSPKASEWVQVDESGFGNANNTAFESLVRYRGARYISTVNKTDGAEAFKIVAE